MSAAASHLARRTGLGEAQRALLLCFLFLSASSVFWASAYAVLMRNMPPVRPAQLAFALLVLMFVVILPAYRSFRIPFPRPVQWWLLSLIAAALSAFASRGFPGTLVEIADDAMAFLMAWTVCATIVESPAPREFLARTYVALGAGCALSALAAVAMFFSGYVPPDAEVSAALIIGPFIRQPSVFDDPNYFASTLLLGIAAGTAIAFAADARVSHRLRMVGVLAMVLSLIGIFTTLSRGGILAMLAFFVIFALVTRRIRLWVLSLVLVLCTLVIWAVLGDAVMALFEEKVANAGSEYSLLSRIAQMYAGFAMLVENPLLGVGPGQFAARYLEYDGGFAAYQSNIGWRMHSTYLETLFEQGSLGSLAFIALVGVSIHSCVKLFRASRAAHRAIDRTSVGCLSGLLAAELVLAGTVAIPSRLGFILALTLPLAIHAALRAGRSSDD